MKEDLNIEELFKSKFENFESQVDPSAWANISQSIGAGAASGASGASAVGLSTFAKVAIVAGITAITSVGVWYFTQDESGDTTQDNQPLVVQNDESTDNIEVENSSTEPAIETEDNSLNTPVNVDESSTNESNHSDNTIVNNSSTVEITNDSNQEVQTTTNSNNQETAESSQNTNQSTEQNSSNQTTVSSNNDEQSNNTTTNNTVVKPVKANPQFELEGNKLDCTGNAENHTYVKWDFGDGEIASGDKVSHVYKKPGKYEVTTTVYGKDGEFSTSEEVEVVGTSKMAKIPNVLTPNGDNNNDYFFIECEGIDRFLIIIYSPEGEPIFTSEDPTFEWDGRLKDGSIKEGKYPYVINARGEDGQTFQRAGAITLTL